MNISENLQNLLNIQVSHEMHNCQIYRFFANRLGNIGLTNLAKFFENQAKGEIEHSEIIIKYMTDRNIDIEFIPIESVNLNYNSILDIAKLTLETEQKTTALLKQIAKYALEEMDLLTFEWIQSEMIKEQISEEEEAQTLVDKLTNIGDNMSDIQIFDNSFSI